MGISEKDARRLGIWPEQTSARSSKVAARRAETTARAGSARGMHHRESPLVIRPQELCEVIPISLGPGPSHAVADQYVFHIQRELHTANALVGQHWTRKHRERVRWQTAFCNALVDAEGVAFAQARLLPTSGLFGATGQESNRTWGRQTIVRITRLVPSMQHFIRDEDNLMFAAKQLVDALKRCGFVYDDDRRWCERPLPTQALSADGTHWTMVEVTPLE